MITEHEPSVAELKPIIEWLILFQLLTESSPKFLPVTPAEMRCLNVVFFLHLPEPMFSEFIHCGRKLVCGLPCLEFTEAAGLREEILKAERNSGFNKALESMSDWWQDTTGKELCSPE